MKYIMPNSWSEHLKKLRFNLMLLVRLCRPFFNSSYFSQSFDIPTHPRVHIRSKLKQKCLQKLPLCNFKFSKDLNNFVWTEVPGIWLSMYLKKFRMLGLALSLWLVNLSVSIRAQYSDRWIPLVPDKLFGYL